MEQKRRERARAIIALARQQPCADCGLVEPEIMHFDHVPERGPVLFRISFSKANGSVGKLLAEIAKCDVVCPNCHERRTIRRGQRAYYGR